MEAAGAVCWSTSRWLHAQMCTACPALELSLRFTTRSTYSRSFIRCKPFDGNRIFSSRAFLTASNCRGRTRSWALHASFVGSDKPVFLFLLFSSHHCVIVGLSFSHILTGFQQLLNQIVQKDREGLNSTAKIQQIIQIRIDYRILDRFCCLLLRPPFEKFRR